MNRFFVPPHWIEGNIVQLKDSYPHQIMQVLRLKPGDGIVVLDNTNHEYDIELSTVDEDRVIGRIKHQRACITEPKVHLTLFQSLLKRDKFEWILQKCTEVGVAQIVPVITRRSLVQKARFKPQRLTRWQTILREAAEQCGRGRMPGLGVPMDFFESLKRMDEIDLPLIAAPQADAATFSEVMAAVSAVESPRIGLWIGPEGGFDAREIREAVNAGAVCVSLGRRVLRTETAAVVACTLALHELGEL